MQIKLTAVLFLAAVACGGSKPAPTTPAKPAEPEKAAMAANAAAAQAAASINPAMALLAAASLWLTAYPPSRLVPVPEAAAMFAQQIKDRAKLAFVSFGQPSNADAAFAQCV